MMKTHILLIDDDEDELEILTAALNKVPLTFDCMWVQSAEHAVELLNHYTPDYIFIDYNMPKENGLKCLAEIKKIKTVRDIPVILYSTSIDEVNSSQALSLGALTCLQKQTGINALAKQLKEIITSAQGSV